MAQYIWQINMTITGINYIFYFNHFRCFKLSFFLWTSATCLRLCFWKGKLSSEKGPEIPCFILWTYLEVKIEAWVNIHEIIVVFTAVFNWNKHTKYNTGAGISGRHWNTFLVKNMIWCSFRVYYVEGVHKIITFVIISSYFSQISWFCFCQLPASSQNSIFSLIRD